MNFKKIICCALTLTLISSQSFGQAAAENTTSKAGPRKQLTIIFLAGLGGAVLGLSTLSFRGRPQDHLGNIGLGFAAGVVVGTIYVTYNTAKKPREYWSEYNFGEIENKTNREFLEIKDTPPLFTYTFDF